LIGKTEEKYLFGDMGVESEIILKLREIILKLFRKQ
jgi:hypothetical protein